MRPTNAAYNVGGLALELASQSFRAGSHVSASGGLRRGVGFCPGPRHRGPPDPGGSGPISLVLFTRVQNMGSHQSLLLMPGYFILMLLGVAALARHPEPAAVISSWGYWLFALAFSLSARLSPLTTIALPDFLL